MKICIYLLIIFSIYSYPQVILKIGDKPAVPEEQVNLSVRIKNAGEIGAVSLKIQYDNVLLKFIKLENTVEDFSYNDNDGTLIISWFDITATNPMNVNDTSILDLVFQYKSGNSQVKFLKEECELSDPPGNILNVDYQDGSITSIDNINNESTEFQFSLKQNYPNPFNPSTTISYSLSNPGFIKLSVFDLMGKIISVLIDDYINAGNYSVVFNGQSIASGLYIYELVSGNHHLRKKMAFVK